MALRDNIKSLEIHEQNDINEFLMIFLDKINRDIAVKRVVATEEINQSHDQLSVLKKIMNNAWNSQTTKEYSELVPMFYGQLISQINCGYCLKIYHNYELFTDLAIPIDDNCNTLYDCLDAHFKEEVVNKDEQLWRCDKCEKKCESNKCVLIWKAPQILIISLKRFSATTMRKNAKQISIPETLDISKYCLNNKNNIYKLAAAGVHMGFSQLGGHYYAVCKGYDGKWYKIDDLDVRTESSPNVENGYVYFYVRAN
jgi:ubiquitin C-terminal hydrolase